MKVYDDAAMIADKAMRGRAVRIGGWSRRRSVIVQGTGVPALVPKVTVTILEPVRLTVDPNLRGRKRRLAAGAALRYHVGSSLPHPSTDRTVMKAVIRPPRPTAAIVSPSKIHAAR
jgi:acyl-[acyl-carrier-protein]-phospholipid O-acyltransferase/long-chain-fatty-acid--[acyl-carrier-protein] ligase